MKYFTIHPATLNADGEDECGILVYLDDKIVAVFSKLTAEYHEQSRGFWFLETGFGRCAAPPRGPFERLSEGLSYLSGLLGQNVSVLASELTKVDAC